MIVGNSGPAVLPRVQYNNLSLRLTLKKYDRPRVLQRVVGITCHGLPTKLRRTEYLERFPTTQDKGRLQQLQLTRHLIPPKLTASGELGLITAAVLISVAYLLLGQATGAVSLMDAIAFAGAAIPASILTLFVCGHFFHRLSIAAGLF